MSWFLLFISAVFEVAWASTLKYTDGFTKLVPSIINFLLAAGSFYFLGRAVRLLPIGTAYAVWTGASTIGVVLLGIIFLKESSSFLHLFFILLILIGVLGLKFVAPV